jgi:hypothetical protein
VHDLIKRKPTPLSSSLIIIIITDHHHYIQTYSLSVSTMQKKALNVTEGSASEIVEGRMSDGDTDRCNGHTPSIIKLRCLPHKR